MLGKTLLKGLLAAAVVASAVAAQAAVMIDLVPVGDAGNAADTRYNSISVGSVAEAYAIGKYEVTAGQYTAFLSAVAATDPYGLYSTSMWSNPYGCKIQRSGASGSYTYSVDLDYANRPVNYISWGDAARFANWLNNGQPTGAQGATTTEDGAYYLNGATSDSALITVTREADAKWVIPSEDEWYKAAYYKGGGSNAGYWDYPTRSNTVPGRDMADVSGNNANSYGSPFPIDLGKYTTVVGEFQNSKSPYGTFDQEGNVWEWNETTISGGRGLRGGSFGGYAYNLALPYRFDYPTYEDGYRGFRVASVPEPGSITLLVTGAIAGLICRRRASGRSSAAEDDNASARAPPSYLPTNISASRIEVVEFV